MNIENLVTMANQIGAYYETLPDRTQAIHDIAEHIRKFWEPRMRRELLAFVDDSTQEPLQLTPIVSAALQQHRTLVVG